MLDDSNPAIRMRSSASQNLPPEQRRARAESIQGRRGDFLISRFDQRAERSTASPESRVYMWSAHVGRHRVHLPEGYKMGTVQHDETWRQLHERLRRIAK